MPELCSACATMGFTTPTPIQREAIPNALRDRDLIGLAQTGSGKTAAFSLPILQALWKNPSRFFACVLSPTRELAYQIAEQITSLGADIGVRCVVIVGGMSMMDQALALSKNPHIVIGTPGRLIDHLENTKGFSLKTLKYLVLDEADRLLDMDFGPAIEKLLKAIPRERHTYLFSATMTTKVEKLQKASLKNPYKVEIATKYSTVANLLQYYMFIPFKHKELYLAYLLSSGTHRSTILFTYTATTAQKLSLMLRHLGFRATCLYGTLSQPKRLAALEKFKSGERSLLVATDVASRGLDIPSVDLVVNYDVPQSSKDYIHRAGRTARAGRAGKCVTLVSQYDIEWYQRIEYALQKKLDAFPVESKTAVMALAGRVNEALKVAQLQLKEEAQDRKEGNDHSALRLSTRR
ncbi:hypothetical protein CXG81DRAFT_30433 [Caulochytrium protostelioides]|uniref:ATP-dependent rRNA helicase RRP3 n=1 Tax=Caulochytrium protostelioides TaxID=1555241 RepID=A0A4P9WYF4_9FUNG|nr:hypothetical protein CXG81DRAFT_30433 [Caulochytrium protostelioides]|eukprot:RKO98549.1 hypothetical protein CXG81DRAFT_30433 [Caulochytrium protostelioides]